MVHGLLALAISASSGGDFRVLPYLQAPHGDGIQVNWFSGANTPGRLTLTGPEGTRSFTARSTRMSGLDYSELEEKERPEFPDMFSGPQWKHVVRLTGLKPATRYRYTVSMGRSTHSGEIRTPASAADPRPMRIIAFADSETDPEGRTTFREWAAGPQAEGSTGRPSGLARYLVTETRGLQENLRLIRDRKPDLMLLAGDIVQGGGYQRAWDEFFRHFAGGYDDLLSSVPLVAAIGNWENFGARNGGYAPAAIADSRRRFAAYFDGPSNGHRPHQNFYHRIDFGPVTILTLDSSNGLPDGTDNDSNINIVAADYPGEDLVDAAPGSRMWNWTLKNLADARRKGQIIFVQFHHIPYSGGGHILPTTLPGSSGQAGLVMRAYTPWFQKYGVEAVICGHNESFEWSEVGGVQFFDAGVAGDGLGRPVDDVDPRRVNPWRKWTAHFDEPELWNGRRLVQGGKHYGHLEIDLEPRTDGGWTISYQPVHAFPVTNEAGQVVRVERRPVARRATIQRTSAQLGARCIDFRRGSAARRLLAFGELLFGHGPLPRVLVVPLAADGRIVDLRLEDLRFRNEDGRLGRDAVDHLRLHSRRDPRSAAGALGLLKLARRVSGRGSLDGGSGGRLGPESLDDPGQGAAVENDGDAGHHNRDADEQSRRFLFLHDVPRGFLGRSLLRSEPPIRHNGPSGCRTRTPAT
ncbi:MAG: metallophosphoesterase family protein [Fimbriimonadaceae bacterium]|nr:metallophosphoesterase family protein [Fimbriimonadaceae bacterium]